MNPTKRKQEVAGYIYLQVKGDNIKYDILIAV